MSNLAPQIDTTVTPEKRKGGRPVNPNNMTIRAQTILSALTTEQLKKDIAVPMLVEQLGCKESSAMTYFYTFKAKNKA